MAQLFEQKYPNNIRTISGNVLIKQDDVVLLCDTSLGAVNITLLGIPANYWSTQYKLYIVDKNNNASVNNITINAGATTDPNTGLPVLQKLNGLSSCVINTNGGSMLIRIQSNTEFIGVYSGGGVSSSGFYQTVQDEGVNLPSRLKLNFIGTGVSAVDDLVNNRTNVTISGAGVTSLTNAQYLALQTAGTVVQGQTYLITDALYTDGGVLVQGVLNNAPPSVNGVGIHLNADYQGTGDYSGVTGFGAWKNIWCLPAIPVVAGDVVVWNNLHYKNLTGSWGTAPDGDAVNWQVLPKSVTNGYKLECDFVKYNVNLNSIIYRADKRLNEVDLYSDGSGVNLLLFQWGRNVVVRNKLRSSSQMVCTNSYCQFINNTLDSGRLYDQTNRQESGTISLNYISQDAEINLFQTKGTVTQNTVSGFKSRIFADGVNKIIMVGHTVQNNTITGGSQIKFDTISCDVLNNTFIDSSGIDAVLYTTSVSSNYMVNYGKVICSVALDNFIQNQVSNTSINVPSLVGNSNSNFELGQSTFLFSLDFTDPAIWNGGTQTLTIPLDRKYCGIFYLKNVGAGLTISKIINMPNTHKSTFYVDNASTSITFQHTLVAGTTAGDLCCDAPASANLITYRANGTDFIEYIASGNVSIRTNLVLLA